MEIHGHARHRKSGLADGFQRAVCQPDCAGLRIDRTDGGHGPTRRPSRGAHAQGLGIQVGLRVNQELAADNNLVTGLKPLQHSDSIGLAIADGHGPHVIGTRGTNADNPVAMSRTDDGLHRHCQHRSARLQRQRHVGVHSRDQRFVRIFEHQTDASRSSPGIDFGAEQIDPAAPLPARQSRHNSLGLHPFLDQARQMGRHIRE